MNKLVLGTESIEIKAAKERVLLNLQMFNERIQGLCNESASYSALNAFYKEGSLSGSVTLIENRSCLTGLLVIDLPPIKVRV